MPRIRTIKPEHWSDRELSKVSLQAHLMWIGTWNFSDDKGIFDGDPILLKSQIFPRRIDVRIEQISQWLDQLVKARFIIPFTHEEQGYYINRTFDIHQRIDKPQPSRFDSQFIKSVFEEYSKNAPRTILPVKESRVQEGSGKERISVSNETLGDKSPVNIPESEIDESKTLKKVYSSIPKDKKNIHEFIRDRRPQFYEPYIDFWNLFAEQFKIPEIKKVSTKRMRKLLIRLSEKEFDFCQIMRKANSGSDFLLTSSWFSFDWIIQNQENYLKLLEGNYDKKDSPKPQQAAGSSVADEIRKKRLQLQNNQ